MNFHTSLPMRLHRALDAVLPPFRALFSEFDLTEQQWRVLRCLWDQPDQSQKGLATATLIPSNSLVGVLDRLERRGLIARLRSTTDRRVIHVRATPEGRALGDQIIPLIEPIYGQLEARLGADRLADLYAALEALSIQEEINHVAA